MGTPAPRPDPGHRPDGPTTAGRRSFTARLIGAARLDIDTYEEVEADTGATPQAALVVCLSAVSLAIGQTHAGLIPIVAAVLREMIGWLVWSGITYLIGAKVLKGTATWGELQRTIGFAMGPGFLYALAAIPYLSEPVTYLVGTWKLVAAIVAIRQALDFGTDRALVTAVLGFIAYVSLAYLEALILGLPLPAG
jgi:hypothetical protein